MTSLLLKPLELAINRYLRLDPETIVQLAKLENRVIWIELTDIRLKFFLLPQQNGVKLVRYYPFVADTKIITTTLALWRMSKQGFSTRASVQENIDIEGDIDLGHQVTQILRSMDVDWEEQLAKYCGDVAAQQLGQVARSSFQFVNRGLDNVQRGLAQYLPEAGYLPPAEEMEDFINDMAKLREDVDRLLLRYQRVIH